MSPPATASLLEHGRHRRLEALAAEAEHSRESGRWTATAALELALAWLLAGDLQRADLALLEADQLAPPLALVPDVWGLWPAPVSNSGAVDGEALTLAERYRAWRHADAQALWAEVLPALQADWRVALEPAVGDPLRILCHLAGPGGDVLEPALEPELARLVSDAEIQAEPAASSRYWQLIAGLRPAWDLARIRAADLALARGDVKRSGEWLADPPAAALANPWFHDVVARQAVARADVAAALEAWGEAIRAAQAEPDRSSLRALFEQRRREARRGPGVLQVRHLASKGDQAGALSLLETLLAGDPEWPPLRSLNDQLRKPPSPARDDAGPRNAMPRGKATGSSFDALLDRATARLEALGHPLTALEVLEGEGRMEAGSLADRLEALERRLSDAEARFALA